MRKILFVLALTAIFFSCKQKTRYHTIIRNGMIYDGNGGDPYTADIGVNADIIEFIGDLKK